MTLSVRILYRIDDRMINKSGAVYGMKIGRKNGILGKNLLQCHFNYHKSHMT
jgi:hypothetical protein